MRTDSPTCDIEGLNILLSWVSCERLTVKSGDITNAYSKDATGTVDLTETTTWRSAGC